MRSPHPATHPFPDGNNLTAFAGTFAFIAADGGATSSPVSHPCKSILESPFDTQ